MAFNEAVYEIVKSVLASLNRIERKLEFVEDELCGVSDELFEVGERLSELSQSRAVRIPPPVRS